MRKKDRINSAPELVEACRDRIDQRLCYFRDEKGEKKHGIIHKVYAARFCDQIRCLVASDDGIFYYKDVNDVMPH